MDDWETIEKELTRSYLKAQENVVDMLTNSARKMELREKLALCGCDICSNCLNNLTK